MDVDRFYGKDGLPPSMRQVAEAISVCGTCPVQIDCLITALKDEESHGVWGGMARHERTRAMLKHSGDVQAVVADYEAQRLIKSMGEGDGGQGPSDEHGGCAQGDQVEDSAEGLRTATRRKVVG
jgi:hypothetical protein